MDKRKLRLSNGEELFFPMDITCEEDSTCIRLKITKPSSNMQEDASAFESWALILRVKTSKKIILSFDRVDIDSKHYFKDPSPHKQHYMRFLYRLSKFQKQMVSWFSVSADSQKELDLFEKEFNSVNKVNNVPDGPSEYNEGKGFEHILEKAFVSLPKFRAGTGINFELSDQLPNGLFIDEVATKNKIFNTGKVDLWGIDPVDNAFVLFELKEPENKKLGIISELFFYSNFAFDLLNEKNKFKLNQKKSKYRNYGTFLEAQKATGTKVKAVFLVNNLHPELEDEKQQEKMLELLNENSPVSYCILKYEIDEQSLNEIKTELKKIYPPIKSSASN